MMVMTLQSPRYSMYQDPNIDIIQKNVVDQVTEIVNSLGFYPIQSQLDLLDVMKQYEMAVLFLGLIFSIVIILFVIISCLLIYSLLMISVETKRFESGV
jgi:hypothetical protein